LFISTIILFLFLQTFLLSIHMCLKSKKFVMSTVVLFIFSVFHYQFECGNTRFALGPYIV